jgi:uncharacterized protein DUF6364
LYVQKKGGVHLKTKLTLRLDARLIRRAKAYARRRGKSLSMIIADFFAGIEEPGTAAAEPRSPAVRSLAGALSGHRVDEEDYHVYLERKHR